MLLMKKGFFANGNFPNWVNISAFSARLCSPDTNEVKWWPEDVKFKTMNDSLKNKFGHFRNLYTDDDTQATLSIRAMRSVNV